MDIMQFLTPITRENLCELQPGEWIWDNKMTERNVHERSLGNDMITEPIGFRQIDILDVDYFISGKPFMLSNSYSGYYGYGTSWTYFEEGRFFMFKRDKED